MEEIYGIIYLITNTVNGKVYVGQTIRKLEQRWRGHCNSARAGSSIYFHNAIRRYGEDSFVVEVLDSVDSLASLNFLEILYILLFRSTDRLIGYNGTLGGECTEYTPETREKISKAMMGKSRPPPSQETRDKISKATVLRILEFGHPQKGRPQSASHRLAISAGNKGKNKMSPERRRELGIWASSRIRSEDELTRAAATRKKTRESKKAAGLLPPKKTHCVHGHDRTPENLSPTGQCKTCANARRRISRRLIAAAKKATKAAEQTLSLAA